jgi:hypothetical protein
LKDAAVVSALVIPTRGDDGVTKFARRELMHSYHNVAELRQINGALNVKNKQK